MKFLKNWRNNIKHGIQKNFHQTTTKISFNENFFDTKNCQFFFSEISHYCFFVLFTWNSKARYDRKTDPTPELIRRACQQARAYAKNDRVVFHYNGHGLFYKMREIFCGKARKFWLLSFSKS